MLLLCLCMLTGAYSLGIISQLPAPIVFHALLVLALACVWRRRLLPCAFFLLGLAGMGLAAAAHKADQLADGLQRKPVFLTARVVGFPVADSGSVRFVVRPVNRPDLPPRVRLSWREPETAPEIGETWRLHVRLKKPRGYANPGGFDYEGWLFRQRIGATGYVVADSGSYRVHGQPRGIADSLRQRFVTRVTKHLPQDDASAVLMAIGAGARHGIHRNQWDLYARTGTSHLMAISGLHIGLAAACAYLSCRVLLAPFARRRNVRDVATVVAVLAAVLYALFSGFAVPAQRALLMALVAGTMLLLRRRVRPSLLLAIPLFAIFFCNPLALLAPGFMLSFGAVAILFLVAGRYPDCLFPGIAHAGRAVTGIARLIPLQFALLAGLFPFTVLIFDRVALVAPLVNLLVLPVFNFITVPLTLTGALFDGPFHLAGISLLGWAHGSIRGVLWLVNLANDLSFANLHTRRLDSATVLVATLPLLYVLLPPAWPGRRFALLAMFCVLVYRPPPPPPGCLELHVLDVGQGLAVVLRTRQKTLLFDTGPSFPGGGDMADLVVLPFLYGLGVDRLDTLVISHGDVDHAGGTSKVIAGVAVADVMVGERLGDVQGSQRRCAAGMAWQWDGVRFLIIHPRRNAPWDRNNASCVLSVQVGESRLLLTGDIEMPAETLLLYRASVLPADTVLVPHHGSLTSSSAPFVAALRPGLAIVSAGFGNRWNLPNTAVTARWEAIGARVLNTATAGAVSQRICQGEAPGEVRLQRVARQKYWHDAPPAWP